MSSASDGSPSQVQRPSKYVNPFRAVWLALLRVRLFDTDCVRTEELRLFQSTSDVFWEIDVRCALYL